MQKNIKDVFMLGVITGGVFVFCLLNLLASLSNNLLIASAIFSGFTVAIGIYILGVLISNID